jgi:hypothetical protein
MSLIKFIITEKLTVYSERVQLPLLGIDSLIMTPSRIIGSNNEVKLFFDVDKASDNIL